MAERGSVLEVLAAFTRLGLTSFGGPVAHLSYFREDLVGRRRWVSEETYADLVALCQFLPGPASSQVGMALGIERAGLAGGVAAWLGFTMPSAIALTLFALGVGFLGPDAAWIHGLKVVAVPVVALAIWGMATKLCPDPSRTTIAIAAAAAAMHWDAAISQVAIIAVAAVLGFALYRREPVSPGHALAAPITRRAAVFAWVLFFGLLAGLPFLGALHPWLDVFSRFYRVGSLVFGGGHVVLPLLESEVVDPGWTTSERFLAGYGAAQAVPGPLFSFAAYLGAVLSAAGGWGGGLLALVAIFLPSYLLVVGALPFWERLRGSAACQAALRGTNAAVVGLLLAAFYSPVFTVAIHSRTDFAIALAAFLALAMWRVPPWLVVVLTAAATAIFPPAPAPKTVVFAVRHAQAVRNVPHPPELTEEERDRLTPLGQEQARELAELFRGRGVTRILVSPTGRTRETAAAIASATGVRPEVAGALVSLAKGESLEEGTRRALALIREGEVVVLVTHGDIVPGLIGHAAGTALADRPARHPVGEGTVAELSLEPGKWRVVAVTPARRRP